MEARYSTTEIEMLAVLWSANKCSLYLLGLPGVRLVVDHQPLLPLINTKSLHQIANPRLQSMREKLLPFALNAVWKKGSLHVVPDAFSRSPVDVPTKSDLELQSEFEYASTASVTAAVGSVCFPEDQS